MVNLACSFQNNVQIYNTENYTVCIDQDALYFGAYGHQLIVLIAVSLYDI
jgi:hypothetical protein